MLRTPGREIRVMCRQNAARAWQTGMICAGVVELVDAQDSKSCSERSVGSSPTARTILISRLR